MGKRLLLLALGALFAWDTGAIAFAPYASAPVRTALACVFALAVPMVYLRARRWVWVPCAVPLLAWLTLLQPSNDRAWTADQQRLPRAEVDGDRVTVHDVRAFTYRSATDFDPKWEDRTYDLARLESAWFIVEPFSSFGGAAHTFLSFGFAGGPTHDDTYLAVSVEIRKEAGESFSPWQGLYRNYEIMYVLGDERDLIALRTEQRHDTVYLYPVRADKAQMRQMLVDILKRANALAIEPEFYNSITNTCTTSIARHVNRVAPGRVPFSWHLLLPGYADERALALGLIDFDGTLDQARARFRINERAARAAGAADFSTRIRAPSVTARCRGPSSPAAGTCR